MYVCIYVCIHIYIILFNPVNPESGIIPIRTNKEIFKNRILYLNIPGKELNVNRIHWANKFFYCYTKNNILKKLI